MKTYQFILATLLLFTIGARAQQLPILITCQYSEVDTSVINNHSTIRSWLDGWDTLTLSPGGPNCGSRIIKWQFEDGLDFYYAEAWYNADSSYWQNRIIGMYNNFSGLENDTVQFIYYIRDPVSCSPMIPVDTAYFLMTNYKPVICLATTVSNQRNELLFDINDITLGDTIDVFRDNDSIGTMVYNNTTTDLIFLDSSLNQNITKKYKYSASVKGTCRNSWANTIYLRYSGGNLVWNDYELDQDEGVIDGYSVYKISNGVTDSIYRMERGVDDVNGIYEFTDLAYVPGDTYFVTAVKTDGCATSKTGNGVITSNKVTVGTVGISEVSTIDQRFLVLGQHQGKLLVKSLEPVKDISVLNLSGQIVRQKVAPSGTIEFNLPVGIYFVTDGITIKKAVVY